MAYNKKYAELGESVIDYVNDREDAIEDAFSEIDYDDSYPLTLLNGWTGNLTYRRMGEHIVAINGSVISPSSVSSRDVISTLPSEANPPHYIHAFNAYHVNNARVIVFGSILDNRNIRIESRKDGTLDVSGGQTYQINTVFYTY